MTGTSKSVIPDPGGFGIGRVHQHDRSGLANMIVDLRRIVAGQAEPLKNTRQQGGALIIEFVEHHIGAGNDGMNGKQARSGRRFEDGIALAHPGSAGGDEGERRRCRKLLQRDLGFGPVGLRRQQIAQALDRPERGLATGGGEVVVRLGKLKQHLRHLGSVIGIAHRPCATGVAGPERAFHQAGKVLAADFGAGFQTGGNLLRDLDQEVGFARCVVDCRNEVELRHGHRASPGLPGPWIAGSAGCRLLSSPYEIPIKRCDYVDRKLGILERLLTTQSQSFTTGLGNGCL